MMMKNQASNLNSFGRDDAAFLFTAWAKLNLD